jgi:hypothetical protein
LVLCGLAAAGVVGGSSAAALGSPAQSPTPTPGTPSCNGLIIAGVAPSGAPRRSTASRLRFSLAERLTGWPKFAARESSN